LRIDSLVHLDAQKLFGGSPVLKLSVEKTFRRRGEKWHHCSQRWS